MRPKKRILLIDANEEHRSVLTFTLKTKGFLVRGAATADEARQAAFEFSPDLVIGCWPLATSDLGELLSFIHKQNWQVRSLVLCEALREAPALLVADVILLKGFCLSEQILERAMFLSARKRGPAKFEPVGQRAVDPLDFARRIA